MKKEYYLGLDLGTDSVGWCVTDQDFNIVRVGGKSLWGVRLFEEAEDASARRMSRSSRRRLQRRKERIDYLQLLFDEEINKVDKGFFQRLELSKYKFEDRNRYFSSKPILFTNDDFTDKEYYKKYPTIYHLRKDLMESNEKFDIRLVYLAIHHIIKYRGNFLNEGEFKTNDLSLFKDQLSKLNDYLNDKVKELDDYFIDKYFENSESSYEFFKVDDSSIEKFLNKVIENSNISSIKESLIECFKIENQYVKKYIVPLIAGSKVKVKDLYFLNTDNEDLEIQSIELRKDTFDDEIEKVNSVLDDELVFDIIQKSKEISDTIILTSLLQDSNTLSDAMVKIYENHNKDLKELKKYVKENNKDLYDKIFRNYDDKVNNYVRYVGSNLIEGNTKRFKKCSKDEFYKFLKETLSIKESNNNAYLDKIFSLMQQGKYLSKQNSTSNGVFPYQLNKYELQMIIEKQSKYYPFLNDSFMKDDNQQNKIIGLLEYKIPYYVGPLNNNSIYSWVERTNEKITPWNFDQVVDKEKTAEKFISRMLNKCSYLRNEFCLPKNSIIYQEYEVLNYINKIAINGKSITIEQKNDLFDKFKQTKKMSKKSIESYFKNKYGNDSKVSYVTGNELEDLKVNLSSLDDFKKILGSIEKVYEDIEKVENIIRDITIFEDKSILRKRLLNYYKDQTIIKKLINLKYKDYGRLSNKLLTGIKTNYENETGETIKASIMYLLKNTNQNFMEIINNQKYNFQKLINDENNTEANLTPEQFIEEQYVSPGMKRTLIQSYKIIEEVEKIIKGKISKFYIESTRKKDIKNKRTNSRKEKLLQLYKVAKNIIKEQTDIDFYNNAIDKLESFNDMDLRWEKLYLYFTQMGKSMYSGKPIDINDLYNSEKTDIDHIYPQSVIKDDSFDNRVLVYQDENRLKKAIYPIPEQFRTNKQIAFYKVLLDNNFISKEKYSRLVRNTELTEDEINDFDNRQLVYTSQSVKALAEVLRVYKEVSNDKIVLVKGSNVSEFRNIHDIIKCRDINDYHHAHDAYLNVVVGNKIHESRGTHLVQRLESLNNLAPFVIQQMEKRKDIMVTHRSYIQNTILNKTSILPAKGGLFPIKNPVSKEEIESSFLDTSKYGGYTEISNGYFCLVESLDKKNNIILSIEAMQNVYAPYDCDDDTKINYLINSKLLKSPKIILDNIKLNTVIEDGKSKYMLRGKGSSSSLLINNISEANYSSHFAYLIHKINKVENIISDKKMTLDSEEEKLNSILNRTEKSLILYTKMVNQKSKEYAYVTIEDDELIDAYNIICSQLEKNIYKNISGLSSVKNNLINKNTINKFNELNIYKKMKVIMEMLKLTQCNAARSNLSFIDLASEVGKLSISNKIINEIKIVSYSITGFYKKILYDGSKR